MDAKLNKIDAKFDKMNAKIYAKFDKLIELTEWRDDKVDMRFEKLIQPNQSCLMM